MKISELRQKTEQELREYLEKLTKEVKDARNSALQSKEKNVKKPIALRKEVARVMTLLTEKKVLNEVTNE